MISAKELVEELKYKDNKIRKYKKIISDIGLFVLCALILLINLYFFGSQNKIVILSASIFILAIIFLLLTFAHRFYEKIFIAANPVSALLIVYILIIINIILNQKAYYSVEWAFLGFVIAAVIFYDFKIDSRFLILPALLLLGYIPFLLIGKFNVFAESIAVYVYYFLVVGVILQFFEQNHEPDLNFEEICLKMFKKIKIIEAAILLIGLFSAAVIIAGRFIQIEFWKWTSVYLFFLALTAYLVSSLLKESELVR